MYIVVCTYRALTGQEDAIIALHESWERDQRARITGYLSGELLRVIHDPQAFVDITRYESAAAAQAAAADPEQMAWQRRLASLTEDTLTCAGHLCAWQV